MATIEAPPAPPMRMSPRARSYLVILGGRHLIVGLLAVCRPGSFESSGFVEAKRLLPFLHPDHALDVWGLLFVAVGAAALAAALARDVATARAALFVSVVLTFTWTGAILAALLTGSGTGWIALTLWTALAAKDVTMLRNPIRVPTEDVFPGIDEPPARGGGRSAS